MYNLFRWLPAILGVLLSAPAGASLTIEVSKVVGATPIAVVPFGWQGAAALPTDVAAVVAADLARSGRFSPMADQDLIERPVDASQVHFRDWRLVNVDDLVIGKITPRGGSYAVQFQLFDVARNTQLAGYTLFSEAKDLRHTAHRIADIIYETLTGEPGAFDSSIAYVTVSHRLHGARYSLEVADSDGYNPQRIVDNSPEPILSPAWSPDGRHLAYVSYVRRHEELYLQDLVSGHREVISSFPGVNGAPAWSPDGRHLAIVLSKDGNSEIYVLDLESRTLRRLTDNPAIDTEPAWSPDGRTVVFTSDRDGTPQIYRMVLATGHVERVTFEGNYNARASYAPDGHSLVMVSGAGHRYRIAVLDLTNKSMQWISNGRLDESPSFAPNGRMVIYSSRDKTQGILVVAPLSGRGQQRLSTSEGDAREPAWSPMAVRF